LLYVLYEVLSGTPVAAPQADHPMADEVVKWMQPYRELPFKVLATLSTGEDTLRELRDFGQCQVLCLAESEEELLQQLRQVPLAEYQAGRRRLAAHACEQSETNSE
jgi:hypothetical protein